MRVKFILALACLSLPVTACVLNADGFAGGTGTADAGNPDSGETATPELEASAPILEAGPSDASQPDAGDAGADSGAAIDELTNLLVNGDFELGCGNWSPPDDTPTNVTLTPTTDAHGGNKSCRVCMNANADTYVYQSVQVSVPEGERTFGQIYVRGAQANGPTNPIQFLVSYTKVGGDDDDSPGQYATPPASDWIRMSMVEELYDDVQAVTMVIVFDGNQNKCVLLDDAALAVIPN